jgi:hypothetical protein
MALLLMVILLWHDGALGQGPTTKSPAEKTKPSAPQDLFRSWSFDKQPAGETPVGFSAHTIGAPLAGLWKVQPDEGAPTPPNVVMQPTPCAELDCFQLLLADGLIYEYPDVAVRLRLTGRATEKSKGWAGLALSVRDGRNLYATVVDLGGDTIEIIKVVDGKVSTLGRTSLKKSKAVWHLLRARRNTTISKEYLEVVFDGEIVLSVEDTSLGAGQIGLVTRGEAIIAFDNLHAAPLYSQKPLSPPAAY